MWFAIDTLEYLRKGGRIGAAQAWMGSALQIKPILTLEEEITPVERVRTRRRAFERMVEFGRERYESGATAWVVQHIHDHETARHLVDECRQIFGSDPVFVSEIGPVIGAHIGPGLLGVGGVDPALLGLAPAQRQEAADGEADHGGADRELALVLADLAAPVRELADAAAQGLDRLAELLALAHDVVADLVSRAGAGCRTRALGALDARRRAGNRDRQPLSESVPPEGFPGSPCLLRSPWRAPAARRPSCDL